jgi:hypothetical protein
MWVGMAQWSMVVVVVNEQIGAYGCRTHKAQGFHSKNDGRAMDNTLIIYI